MIRIPATLLKASAGLVSAISFIVFALLDLLDYLLCIFYRIADTLLGEATAIPCYCSYENRAERVLGTCDGEGEISATLYQRRNWFRDAVFRIEHFLGWSGNREYREKKSNLMVGRWSECNCGPCSWQGKGEKKLHVAVMEPSPGRVEGCIDNSKENVIFLHGFLSSSTMWAETVFPNLSEPAMHIYRLFAVDLLGFGRSPKPWDCLYTLKEHISVIEKSVIEAFQLNSFHLVAHSMGCVIALALAAKYPNSVKSITLVAPPYFPSPSKEKASNIALNRLAEKRVWPPLLFGSSVMSWYEHVGRSVCFIICRNHQKWEWILKLLTRKRDLHFTIRDLTRHTHHSAWHTMHNVICGGAKLMDGYLETVNKSGLLVTVFHGSKDEVVPLECSFSIKLRVPLAKLRTIADADHITVILGREKDFASDLEQIWASAKKIEATAELNLVNKIVKDIFISVQDVSKLDGQLAGID